MHQTIARAVEPGTLTVHDGSAPALVKVLLPVLPAQRYRSAERPKGHRVRQRVELVVLKRGGHVIFSRDADLLAGGCPRPEPNE